MPILLPNPLYALTLWQPWADLIVDGIKPVENRGWAPPQRLIGQAIVIHAGKTYDHDCALDCSEGVYGERVQVKPKSSIVLGAMVGIATIDRVTEKRTELLSESPWYFGPFGWWLRDVVKFKLPIHYKGAQGLWRVEGVLRAAVVAALEDR